MESYLNSTYVLDHIVSIKPTRGEGVGYNKCPPPMLNHFSITPEVERSLDIKITTPLVAEPVDLKTKLSASKSKPNVTKSESSENDRNFDECDDLVESTTSDGEFVEVEDVVDCEKLKPVKKNSYIPRENHIECEPEHYVTMY